MEEEELPFENALQEALDGHLGYEFGSIPDPAPCLMMKH
jgi:hypothetical protein